MRLLSRVSLVASMVALGLVALGAPAFAQTMPFVPTDPPRAIPEIVPVNEAEQPAPLAQLKGKVTLLNLWATWCSPCVREMPSLARLNQSFVGRDFQVVALSVDKGGFYQVGPFLKQNKIEGLTVLVDKTSATMKGFGVKGLPTSILIDREGREVGRVTGDAAWDGPEAKALIEKYLAVPAQKS